jgi:hypothetical protein
MLILILKGKTRDELAISLSNITVHGLMYSYCRINTI